MGGVGGKMRRWGLYGFGEGRERDDGDVALAVYLHAWMSGRDRI